MHYWPGIAYPTSHTEAMYRLVKICETKNKKSSVVLLGVPSQVSNSTTDVFKCWHCNQEGHSCYKCPSLTKAERDTLYQQHQTEKAAGGVSGNNNSSKAISEGNEVDPIFFCLVAPTESTIMACLHHHDIGLMVTRQIGDLKGFGVVWYHTKGIVNIIVLCEIVKKHQITMDTSVNNAIYVHKDDGTI